MDLEKIKSYNCPVEATMDIIGGKYKAIIIAFLVNNTLRYSELQRLIPQATPRMLSKQLKELEQDGIVKRVLYPVVPPKTEYSLAELGNTLVPIIKALHEWGDDLYKMLGVENPCEKMKNMEPKEWNDIIRNSKGEK